MQQQTEALRVAQIAINAYEQVLRVMYEESNLPEERIAATAALLETNVRFALDAAATVAGKGERLFLDHSGFLGFKSSAEAAANTARLCSKRSMVTGVLASRIQEEGEKKARFEDARAERGRREERGGWRNRPYESGGGAGAEAPGDPERSNAAGKGGKGGTGGKGGKGRGGKGYHGGKGGK